MKTLVIDIESTIHEKGNPFSRSNVLCCVGLFDGISYRYFDIEYSGNPYHDALREIKQAVESADLIIGHNVKFDISWLRRYIPNLVIDNVWDTQLFEFISSDQTWIMPSLSDSLVLRGLPSKSDTIATEYWDKGINTTEIPETLLKEYNKYDCTGTFELWRCQKQLQQEHQKALFQLHCDDLLVMQEMEQNGMILNMDLVQTEKKETEDRYNDILIKLKQLVPDDFINWNSNDHLSAVLYGGSIPVRVRETVEKQYKSGPKLVERWGEKPVLFPRLVDPLDRTERDKEGFFFVNEPVLRSLRPTTNKAKELIQLILELAEVEKLLSTYYKGLPELISRMDWEAGTIHGTFNQCVARTGRSSSSRPNLQNFAGVLKKLFISRYAN